MTPITRISRLRHPGVLRDFSWPATLPTFARYNLIYGWNASGKTTISRVLRSLELRKIPEGEVILSINGAEVQGQDFPGTAVNVRVFNRDFVGESVFPVGGGDVPPILVVGKESVEKQKEVERIKKEAETAQSILEQKKKQKQEADRAIDKHCVDSAGSIREALRSSGTNPYNNYDKAKYRVRAERMVKAQDAAAHLLEEIERDRLKSQLITPPMPKIGGVTFTFPDFTAIVKQVEQLLETTVVSSAIDALKNDPPLSSWVQTGLGLHRSRGTTQCLFCEQALPTDRVASLEAHFSTAYERFIARIEEQIRNMKEALATGTAVSFPNRAELLPDLQGEYETAIQEFRTAWALVSETLSAFVQTLEDKRGRPFERVERELALPAIDSDVVARLNAVIKRHNDACDQFQARLTQARERLESDFVSRSLQDFENLSSAVKDAVDAVTKATQEVSRLSDEIRRLEREIVEHRRPAEELNQDLHRYLGHQELSLSIKDTGYAIFRNGSPAYNLSEGETTAIALLYFLKSLRDRRFDFPNGVVVLDDPVSSLDANALFLAFGFIRERTKTAAQLFILTHNFGFFREVRNWFQHLRGPDKRAARFYMLQCACGEDGQRCSCVRELDPLLARYESEYHYLFSRVHDEATSMSPGPLEAFYSFPNIARRLIETFLAFRLPQLSGHLSSQFDEVAFDSERKLRILRFLHTHSHGDAVGEPEHDASVLSETRSVLQDLLAMMKVEDPRHFDAMVAIVCPADEDDGTTGGEAHEEGGI